MNAALQRQILKNGVPFRKESGLPQPRHPPVSVRKGMDEHKFIVEHRGQDQRVDFPACLLHPGKQRLHLRGHELRRRSHEDAAFAVEDALVAAAEHAGFLLGQVCHHAMQLLQVVEIVWIKVPQHPVSLPGVFDFCISFCGPTTVFPLITLLTSSRDREFASIARDEWMERMRLFRRRCGRVSKA